MRTNSSGITETAEFNVDKEKYNSGYDHIFNREKCKCEECACAFCGHKLRIESGLLNSSPDSPEIEFFLCDGCEHTHLKKVHD